MRNYAGIVRGLVHIKFNEEVEYQLPFIRVVEHLHPLLLIGADVLRGGNTEGKWNFGGIHV